MALRPESVRLRSSNISNLRLLQGTLNQPCRIPGVTPGGESLKGKVKKVKTWNEQNLCMLRTPDSFVNNVRGVQCRSRRIYILRVSLQLCSFQRSWWISAVVNSATAPWECLGCKSCIRHHLDSCEVCSFCQPNSNNLVMELAQAETSY